MSQEVEIKILEKGSQLVREKGFKNPRFHLNAIHVEIPKGSFYYYFKSKEDFGLKMIEHLHSGISRAFYGYLAEE